MFMAITNINSIDKLGKYIRDVRKNQNITQDDLAGLSGTGRRFISELENGKKTAQIGKVLHILNILGISLAVVKEWEN